MSDPILILEESGRFKEVKQMAVGKTEEFLIDKAGHANCKYSGDTFKVSKKKVRDGKYTFDAGLDVGSCTCSIGRVILVSVKIYAQE